MNLMRNKSFRRQLFCMILVVALAAATAGYFLGAITAWASAGVGVLAIGLFVAFSAQRYHEIARLAAEVDLILHAENLGRELAFSDYKEGDIAILKNELAKMTAMLRDANRRAEREKTALADALADVSHQIRTPLTTMNLMVPLIEKASTDRERARLLHELETMNARAGWLVATLLKLAKVDAGAIQVQEAPVSAARVVRDATAPLEVAFDLHGVTCEIDANPAAAFTGDASWSTEALENIVKNCMEATPEGGTVRITATEDALACRIVVTDTGSGIAAKDLPHIFERFYRGRASTEDASAPTPQGFGIGLSLAQSLISAQGGTVRAENRPEGGARFIITFPKVTV